VEFRRIRLNGYPLTWKRKRISFLLDTQSSSTDAISATPAHQDSRKRAIISLNDEK